MGLSSSKQKESGPSHSSSSSSTGADLRTSRSRRSRVLKSACLQSPYSDNDDPQVSDCSSEGNGNGASIPSRRKSGPCNCPLSAECYRTGKAEQNDEVNCIGSDIELEEWGDSSFSDTVSRARNASSRGFTSRAMNPAGRLLSRLSFYPGNLSFRLTRANSSRSARDYPASSSSYSTSYDEEKKRVMASSPRLINRNGRSRGCDIFPGCFSNRFPRMQHVNCASNSLQLSPSGLDFCDILQNDRDTYSGHDAVRSRNDIRADGTPDLLSPMNHNTTNGTGVRHSERPFADREPIERNVRFSRTLSVGRLRDRVLRRTPVSDLDFNRFEQDMEVRNTSHLTGRRDLHHAVVEASPENNFTHSESSINVPSGTTIPVSNSRNHVYETPRARETRYRDLLEHRSNFLERRRRIRTQVRALQRLGSRFENLSGHERSCLLSGQHRAGHCTCHIAAQEVNSSDDPTARASISRIVMLADALFEVLDEIHQQSAVLSSRTSVSSIGSVPAPNEVVDSLPLKIYSRLKRKPSEEAAQCYICLVEYEEGDSMRILPCHHEFHTTCIDKWLKEIHRVCPLCRGDICRSDALARGIDGAN